MPVSDNFNRTEQPLSGNWTQQRVEGNYNLFCTQSDGICHTSTANVSNYAVWNANTFTSDQWSECKYQKTSTQNHGCGCTVRSSGITTCNGYLLLVYETYSNASRIELYKFISNAYTILGASVNDGSITDQSVWRNDVTGTTLTGTKDGTQKIQRTDSAVSSGSCGIYGNSNIGNTGVLDDWQAGGEVGVGHPTRKRFGGIPYAAMNRGVW